MRKTKHQHGRLPRSIGNVKKYSKQENLKPAQNVLVSKTKHQNSIKIFICGLLHLFELFCCTMLHKKFVICAVKTLSFPICCISLHYQRNEENNTRNSRLPHSFGNVKKYSKQENLKPAAQSAKTKHQNSSKKGPKITALKLITTIQTNIARWYGELS